MAKNFKKQKAHFSNKHNNLYKSCLKHIGKNLLFNLLDEMPRYIQLPKAIGAEGEEYTHWLSEYMPDGIKSQSLIFLGAEPGHGKTTLMIDLAYNMLRKDQNLFKQNEVISLFSLEMTRFEIYSRFLQHADPDFYTRFTKLCKEGYKDSNYKNELQAIFSDSMQKLEKVIDIEKLYLFTNEVNCNNKVESIQQIITTIEALIQEGKKPALVFIDYLQILADVKSSSEDATITSASISNQLRILKDKHRISMFVLSQLVKGRYSLNSMPSPSDLYGGKQVNNDATAIFTIFKHRQQIEDNSSKTEDDNVPPSPKKKGKDKLDNNFENPSTAYQEYIRVSMPKNRYGSTSTIIDIPYLDGLKLGKHVILTK